MTVLLVTTWDTPCGIAEHSAYLQQAVEAADPTITVQPNPVALDPVACAIDGADLLHLNYHAALHSRWTPAWIHRFRNAGVPVLVTYHDTGVPNSEQCRGVVDAASAAVVHEPFDDLPAATTSYWRMGVPGGPSGLQDFTGRGGMGWNLAYPHQPVLGSIGFPFPWKNYDELARVTAAVGWALYLIAPTATDEQLDGWLRLNPYTTVRRDFVQRDLAIRLLHGCDATAFMYVCHNTGQSGAILQGIAARKPVYALHTCRQFRALYGDPLGAHMVRWVDSFDELAARLSADPLCGRVDPRIVALAHQDGWPQLGQRYAALYRSLVQGA